MSDQNNNPNQDPTNKPLEEQIQQVVETVEETTSAPDQPGGEELSQVVEQMSNEAQETTEQAVDAVQDGASLAEDGAVQAATEPLEQLAIHPPAMSGLPPADLSLLGQQLQGLPPVDPAYYGQQPPVDPASYGQQPSYPGQAPLDPAYYGQQPPVGPASYGQQPPYPSQAPLDPAYYGQQPPVDPAYYGQQQPPYGYDPAAYGQPGGTQPPRGTKIPVRNLALIFGAVALVLVAFFALRATGKHKLSRNPADTMLKAFETSWKNQQERPSSLPQVKRDLGKAYATTMEFSVSTPRNSYSIPMYLDNTKVTYESRTDYSKKQVYFGFSADNAIYPIEPTGIYISPQEIAFSVPNIYRDHAYVTVNTATFVKDWNNSTYGEYNEISTRTDIPGGIIKGYEFIQQSLKRMEESRKGAGDLAEELREVGRNFEKNADIQHLKTTDNDFTFQVEITPRDYRDAIEEVATILEDYQFDQYKSFIELLPDDLFENMNLSKEDFLAESMASTEQITELLRSSTLDEDMTLTITVSRENLHITRVEMDKTIFTLRDNRDYYGSEQEVSVTMDLELKGEDYGMDNLRAKFSVTPRYDGYDEYEDKVSVTLTHKSPTEKNLVGSRWELEFDDGYSKGTIYSDYSWNPSETKGSNTSLKIGLRNEEMEEEYSMILRGNMVAKGESFSFTEGRVSFMHNTEELLAIVIDLSFKPISSGSVRPKITDSADFFSIDWERTFEDFQERVYSVM